MEHEKNRDYPFILTSPDGQSIHIKGMYQDPEKWKVLEIGNAVLLVARPEEPSPKTDKLEKIIEYIDGHLSEKITLQDVADYCGISVSTLTKLFQQRMALSFHQYLTRRRMVAAVPLLLTDVPLESICQQVGYFDYSSFYRAFKQIFGVSPPGIPPEKRKMHAALMAVCILQSNKEEFHHALSGSSSTFAPGAFFFTLSMPLMAPALAA